MTGRFTNSTAIIGILVAWSVGVSTRLTTAAEPHSNCRQTVCQGAAGVDNRDVYVITSSIRGWWPKLGPIRHASIALCPRGVSPLAIENGVPVTNTKVCVVYGTQTGQRGFKREGKRFHVSARKVPGVSAATIEARIRKHSRLNIPLFNDCRHDAIAVTGLRGFIFRQRLAMALN